MTESTFSFPQFVPVCKKAFQYSIKKNIEKCNSNKECKILIVFEDMIADMLSNKYLNPK